MLRDVGALVRLRRQLERRRKDGQPTDQLQARLRAEQEASQRRRAERQAKLPKPTYPQDLPVVARREDIAQAIRDHQVVVICGETGSGKTTQLPKICLEIGRGVAGLIGHTQPRRIAARSLAARIARELRTTVGAAVGYKIRFGDRTSPESFLKIMTDGILLAETQGDRLLRQYDTIIIDEAHERSLNVDFLLGYLKRILPQRPDLKIIITSATIDPERFSEHFDNAPIIEVSGRTYPVATRYRPLASDDPDEQDRDMEEAILHAVDELAMDGPGDILVFLPGERDIRETAEALRKHHPHDTEVLPLYARLSAAEQDRVFRTHRGRRIVLATNVAETSLTVPGIKYVIDPGLARVSRYSHRSRVQRLPIEAVSQASANQRQGRCGRVSDGICIRLYSEEDFSSREEFTPPEILRTNLAAVILQMKALHLGAVEEFPFVEPPDRRMIRDGYDTLRELGAVTDKGDITRLGQDLAKLPVDPRLGRMLLAAEREGALSEVLIIAAALSIQDPRERPMDKRDAADEAHARFADEKSDFVSLLKLWEFYHEQARHLSQNKLRKLCRTNFLSYLRMREWHEIHKQLRVQLTGMGHKANDDPAEYENVHRALLSGLLSHVGMLDDRHEYKGPDSRRFYLFPGSGLFEKTPKWIMSAELVQTTRLYARMNAKIDPAWIERCAPHLIKKSYSDPLWNSKRAHVSAKEKVSLFGLPIVQNRPVHYGPINPEHCRELFILHALVERDFHTKAKFFHHNEAVAEEIRALEAKTRTNNILVLPEEIYAFYDKRIPEGIYNGSRFEHWRKEAERENPELLFMQPQDLMQRSATEITPDRYPDRLTVGDTQCAVSYKLRPGEADDGVTLRVPLTQAGSIDPTVCEYLVPGFLEEKIIALLRGLPKSLRRNFVPVPDFARACAETIEPDTRKPLLQALTDELARLTSVIVPPDAWDLDGLPPHLQMHLAVVDEAGNAVATGDDLGLIRKEVADSLQERLAAIADTPWNRDRLLDWDFGDLPEYVTVRAKQGEVVGFPAIVDLEEGPALRLLESREKAEAATRLGLARLIALHVGRTINLHIDHLPQWQPLLLHASPWMNAESLRREFAGRIVERAFLADRALPRDEVAYRRCLEEGSEAVALTTVEIGRLLLGIFEPAAKLLAELADALPAWSDIATDIRRQLDLLLPTNFATATTWEWLQQYPRYLEGAARRYRKIRDAGPDRDARRFAELKPALETFLELWGVGDGEHRQHVELRTLRWMIEEMRISLFAQELGTALPVSEKRLARQLKKARAARAS
jgi:ATP-dependent RNA helicase HrpA